MQYYGVLWNIVDYYGLLSTTVDYYGILLRSVIEYYGVAFTTMGLLRFSVVEYYGVLLWSIIMVVLSWGIIMGYYDGVLHCRSSLLEIWSCVLSMHH